MSTQGKGEGKFELVTSASLDVVYSQLNYPLRTNNVHINALNTTIYMLINYFKILFKWKLWYNML